MSGSMSGERKRSDAAWPKQPRLSSTLPETSQTASAAGREKYHRAKGQVCAMCGPCQPGRAARIAVLFKCSCVVALGTIPKSRVAATTSCQRAQWSHALPFLTSGLVSLIECVANSGRQITLGDRFLKHV
jgi:hypothetical protein